MAEQQCSSGKGRAGEDRGSSSSRRHSTSILRVFYEPFCSHLLLLPVLGSQLASLLAQLLRLHCSRP